MGPLVKGVPCGSRPESRQCVGHVTVTESPRGRAQTRSTEAHSGPMRSHNTADGRSMHNGKCTTA
eukprot:2041295-Alexandrium_andersonii.AAC.1